MENVKLINDACRGDRFALSSLLYEYRGYIAALVSRFVEDTEQRKDIIQNVFLKVVNSIGKFNGNSRFTTWLFKIVINEVTDFRRKNAVSGRYLVSLLDENIESCSTDALEKMSCKETREKLNELIQELPVDQKTAFILFYYEYYKGKDAALAMNITEQNFFMKLKAARDFIRKKLKQGAVVC
ncbi:sigma-70 family RNA polymerase sigma factor [Chitinispirillales bacterium ANBcel5]|uniref:RNA polymerase sigma factor n=1 Tax=Cellulosispirillum alkaliphilum TaxID=3039283 RepID=UPI002A518BAA|nr:sigma-70 family RNA polymerase sigma factor [Chitinispirillales bacterium ANBcel5]